MDYLGVELHDLLEDDASSELVLPNFQREFVWSKPEQKDLVASFVANIPIGNILLLEGDSGNFASRPLAFDTDATPTPSCLYLLDGQQRVATLKTVFSDAFEGKDEWEPVWRSLFNRLQNRWFLRVVPPENVASDVFGWRNLHFEGFPRDMTPHDVVNYIEYRQIYVTKPGQWHHPAYLSEKESLTENQKRYRVGSEAAEEGLVPLWEIFSAVRQDGDQSWEPVHLHALTVIAERRKLDLKSEHKGDHDAVIDILEHVDPSIEEHLGDPELLDRAWNRLPLRWTERVADKLSDIMSHKIPKTQLPANEPERAIAIFENINDAGTPLTVFDLIVAKAAIGAEGERSLRRQIVEMLSEELEISGSMQREGCSPPARWESSWIGAHDEESPAKKTTNQYLNMLSVLGHGNYGEPKTLTVEHIKRTKQLELNPDQINNETPKSVTAVMRAFAFLQARCGIRTLGDLSYDLMTLPIAYCLADSHQWEDSRTLAKVEYWYWASLFGGSYRERQNPQCVEDIKSLYGWVEEGNENPFERRVERIFGVEEYSDRTTLLLEYPDEVQPPAAIRKGILQFILSRSPQDLLPEEEFDAVYLTAWDAARGSEFKDRSGSSYSLSLHRHHLIPLADATRLGESSKSLRDQDDHVLNSPLNLTYTSEAANRLLSSRSPGEYLQYVDRFGADDHFIPGEVTEVFEKIRSRKGEERFEVYGDIMANRFETLRDGVKNHLRSLLKAAS